MNTFVFFASILALANAQPAPSEGAASGGTSSSTYDASPDVIHNIHEKAAPGAGAEASKPPTIEAATINIKDNLLHVLDLGQAHCDGKVSGNITISNESGQQAYLYPIIQENQDIELFNLGDNGYTKIASYIQTSGKYPEFPGHFAVAKQKVKRVVYSASGQDLKYSVYVIPPEVSSGNVQGKPHQLKFNVESIFTCSSSVLPDMTKSYPFSVTNNARTVSLVSSALVLAFTSILLL